MTRTVAGLRLAANLKWLFTELPFLDRFRAAADAGFAGVEFPDPYQFDPTQLRRSLDDAGLEQVLINTPMGRSGTDESLGWACHPGRDADFRDGIDLGLEYAVALRSPLLHVVAGLCPTGVDNEQALSQYSSNLCWAAERAHGSNVRLVVEAQNHRDAPRFVLAGQDAAAAAVKEANESTGRDDVGLLFDVYHCRIDDGDPAVLLRRLLPLVAHVQVADSPRRGEPGTGEVEWPAVFEALTAGGYTGWVGAEYRPVGDTLSGLSWTEEFVA